MSEKDTKILKWRFDVNTFRLIGRELITDRITAVYELVKNCYDANATEVNVIFENVGQNYKNGKIIISDNGIGMSFKDVEDKWMVVGTASKRNELFSQPPFKRRYVGEKGIGRFAVDKLGGKVNISTKKEGDTKRLVIDVDWTEYERLSKNKQMKLFTDIENYYHYKQAGSDDHGTTLTITYINEIWTKLDIIRIERELEKIISPFYPINPSFNIFLTSNEFKEYSKKPIKPDPVKYFSHNFTLKFDKKHRDQDTLKFDKTKGIIVTETVPIMNFGPVKLELYYFNESAKRKYNASYKNDEVRIDGIKIYRDGIVTTPFAEFESQRDKKRDILGIDKRLWSGAWDKIGTREIIGVLDITKDENPKIIDATNRQDFVDNEEYRELKDFIIQQLNVLGELKKHEREKGRTETTVALEKAGTDVKEFEEKIKEIETKNPDLQKFLTPLKKQAKAINKSINRGIQQQKRERKESIRKENIYLSLMSLQDYAIHISHAVRTSLGKVKRMAEFFKKEFPNAKYDSLFKEYADLIFNEMKNLNRVIDFMLSYAGSNIDLEDFSVKELLENLLGRSYKSVFQSENIHAMVKIEGDCILHANKKFFEDIFQNLISNSIKALKDERDKIIKCTSVMSI